MKKIIFALIIQVCSMSFLFSEDNFEVDIPILGVTDSSVYIVWDSLSSDEKKSVDSVIYLNGTKLKESASENAARINKNVAAYKNSFFKYYIKKLTGLEMIVPKICFYKIENLTANTEYKISVRKINKRGKEISSSKEIVVRTLKKPTCVIDITDYGAEFSEKITSYDSNSEIEKMIEKNTLSIQKAIDSCEPGGIVYIPNGIFMSGSLNLKSNITLKIDGVLCASPYAKHFDFGFLMYKYYTDKRYYGLLNANNAENIRICGSGTIDGNGWKFSSKDGKSVLDWQTYTEEGDVDFSEEKINARQLIKYKKSNNKKVYEDGILAASCALTFLEHSKKTLETASNEDLKNAYSSRSTTLLLRNVKNLFISDLLFLNPANHMINILDSENIVVTGITVFSYDCNNGDGVGLICSENALIYNNFFDTGDDSIVFSAGVGKSAYMTNQSSAGKTKIFSNYFHHGHGGVAFGSHTALGIKDVIVEDNIFNHTDSPFRIKSAPANGGEVSNIHFRRNSLALNKQPFIMSTEYNDSGTVTKYGAADKPAVFYNIHCSDCTVYGASGTSICIIAKPEYPHHDIFFSNVKFSKCSSWGDFIKNCINFEKK